MASKQEKGKDILSYDFNKEKPLDKFDSKVEEADVVIAILDTGIWPESPVFCSREEYEENVKFQKNDLSWDVVPNRKIIDVESCFPFYNGRMTDYKNPRDMNGHGSGCAAILAGNRIENVHISGFNFGTVEGIARNAKLIVFKCAWQIEEEMDLVKYESIIKAFNAISVRGVDIVSISLSQAQYRDRPRTDASADGSLDALMKKGSLTVGAVGNGAFGDEEKDYISNTAPWILTVGACNQNYSYIVDLTLGDGTKIEAICINYFASNKSYPLIRYEDLEKLNKEERESEMKDKFVLCPITAHSKGAEQILGILKDCAGVLIRATNGMPKEAYKGYMDPIPCAIVDAEDGQNISDYVASYNHGSTVSISSMRKATDNVKYPVVAEFSSTWPPDKEFDILKPDIVAPGINILTATSPAYKYYFDGDSDAEDEESLYQICSGTSMACPYVAGIAANLKAKFQRESMPLSAAGIKSAIITTATPILDTCFSRCGAGVINPERASDPGLIYDVHVADFCRYMMGSLAARNLNLPSLAVSVTEKDNPVCIVKRRVTNIVSSSCSYKVEHHPTWVHIDVEPAEIQFRNRGDEVTFRIVIFVEFDRWQNESQIISTSLTWDEIGGDHHSVRMPIVLGRPAQL